MQKQGYLQDLHFSLPPARWIGDLQVREIRKEAMNHRGSPLQKCFQKLKMNSFLNNHLFRASASSTHSAQFTSSYLLMRNKALGLADLSSVLHCSQLTSVFFQIGINPKREQQNVLTHHMANDGPKSGCDIYSPEEKCGCVHTHAQRKQKLYYLSQ